MSPVLTDEPRKPSATCPCCGYVTLPMSSGADEICTICLWFDDPSQRASPESREGANRTSLAEAQANFRAFGACELSLRIYARAPRESDRRDPRWTPFHPSPSAPKRVG